MRFSCLSAADPESIPDVRKEMIQISVNYNSTEVKQGVAAVLRAAAKFSVKDSA